MHIELSSKPDFLACSPIDIGNEYTWPEREEKAAGLPHDQGLEVTG
jgi:hypothetical protein